MTDVEGQLRGRRILVTGASSGIGAAIARAVADEGGRVALLARRHDRIGQLATQLGGVAVPADVTDVSATRVAVDRAARELDGLDGIVNAAGLLHAGTVGEGDPDGWRSMFEVNVLGLLHATQAAISHLRTSGRGSDVVNISSMSGRRLGSPEMGVYAGSKAAVHAVSEGLRRELTGDGVRVTVIAPGLVHTDIFGPDAEGRAAQLRDRAAEIGLGVDDVARSVVDVLAAPPHVVHVEVALLPLDQ